MKLVRRRIRRPLLARSAVTLVEVVISIALVGGLLVAALDLLAASAGGQKGMGDKGRAQLLALDLISEALQYGYEDPDGTPVFGVEVPEEGTDNRGDFDDVDDYHNWTASPPQVKDSTEMTGMSDWERAVTVEYVDPNDLANVVGSDAGVKRITVTVSHRGAPMATVVAIRANAT